ncbi:nucleotide-binding universal stress UspA family protein [Ulvibacter sp. MAR_2010_11]|uniref:universal stress protein n=1 Tax=Ulvibacter sp. MAR_2010_11 TaxID=1250229 RepID=UPI000C2CB255|nr:universal stress protein [Ulvibacter sp. MAR_2010_11]PKA84490.1 nucleotide-binding universal stress UspA family protein [Ulvibacter sp. MAR_2010_11]
MKTILIPTDFSKNAYCALHYATQLFAAEKCKFIIVHSFENQVTHLTSRVDIGKTEAVVEELYNTYENKCDEVKHKIILDTNRDNHSFKAIATSLKLSRAINKLIEKEQVDFVVMGSKGSTGARDILMGSNTLAMIQKIKKAPLLVIPHGIDYTPIEKIAFASGLKRGFAENELNSLLYLSLLHNASIQVLHLHKKEKMTEIQTANLHHLSALLKKSKPENNWLQGGTDVYDAITTFITKEHIDLLSMIYYKHNAIVRLFREATVRDIAKYALVPFLIIPKQD